MEKINSDWSVKLRSADFFAVLRDADFFVTGSAQMRDILALNYLPGKGVNLSAANQTLQESYSIAAQVFEHVAPGTIKFVLIELQPYKMLSDLAGYETLKTTARKEFSQTLRDYFKLCTDNGAHPVITIFPTDKNLPKTSTKKYMPKIYGRIKEAGNGYTYSFIQLINNDRFYKYLYGESNSSSGNEMILTSFFSQFLYREQVVSLQKIIDMPADYFDLLSKYFPDEYTLLTHYIFVKMPYDDFKRLSETMPAVSTELSGAKFFATGDACTAVGLNLNCIPGKGVNLSAANQTLHDGFLTAKQVFEHVAPNTIKFVLIGLSPSSEDISPILEDYLKLCKGNGAHPVVVTFPVASALLKTFDANILQSFRNAVAALVQQYKGAFVDLLDAKLADKSFQDKQLLNAKGAAEASTLLVKALYKKGIISTTKFLSLDKVYKSAPFKRLQEEYMTQVTRIFCDMAYEDFKRLSETMPADECKDLMARVFVDRTYEHLYGLSNMLPKDEYNDIAARIFKLSAQALRRKDKIKIGFVLYDSSMWCGDDLYNLFAQDERFEPTIFLCARGGSAKNEALQNDFLQSVNIFKSHGLNFVAPEKLSASVPVQDVLIFLTPYFWRVLSAFRPLTMTLKTLITYIPYSFGISVRAKAHYNTQIFHTAWKIFISSMTDLKVTENYCTIGVPRGLYSGYPRLDVFFEKNRDFHFDWKMARPDAKKIIYAPHHSVTEDSVKFSTFRWNYQFMYEFAKAHPEISWVVKPHPNLSYRTVRGGIFSSIKKFEEYMQKWNDLPNAQVYTGAYYQAIFATSDGMIHDSVSFVAEYQCVDKPMIYLTRETQICNELGKEILDASYCVDGKDLDGIAAMMQRVFINGDDYKAAERRKVFDESLNYPKTNGMLASEFIFKSIADEVKAPGGVD